MRLLSRKIYRAFPELDQFDDETCKRYINRTSGINTNGVGCLLMIFVFVASFTAWVFIEYNAIQVGVFWLLDKIGIRVGPYTEIFIYLFAYSGYIWFPWVMLLLARDRWLYTQIKKQLKGVGCRECGYCLVGLPINETRFNGFVVCPECNCENFFNDRSLTRADVDPTLGRLTT
jgi:hypothetical protein